MNTSIIGRGWTLPTASQLVKPNELGQLISLTTEKNEIEQAIGIILMTAPGERVMRPDFGCRIHELIFAPNNRDTAVRAERYVAEALGAWEPRIVVNHVAAQPSYREQEAALMIDIQYTVKATKDERSLVYPFYLIPGEE